jgi:hypothetical protein
LNVIARVHLRAKIALLPFPLNVDGVWTEKFWCGGLSGYPY